MRKDENGRDIYVIYDTSMAYFTPFFSPRLHLVSIYSALFFPSQLFPTLGILFVPFCVLQETCEELNVLHFEFPLQ